VLQKDVKYDEVNLDFVLTFLRTSNNWWKRWKTV